MENELMGIITKKFKEKLENGDIENIVDKKINELVEGCLDDLFKWNGTVKQEFKNKLSDVMLTSIIEGDFSEYVTKIRAIFTKALQETALPEYEKFVNALQYALGSSAEKQTVKLSEIFKKYCEIVASQTIGENDLYEELDPNEECVSVTCSCELEEEGMYYKTKKVHFKVDVEDNEISTCSLLSDYNLTITLLDSYRSERCHVVLDKLENIKDFKYLNDFQLYLLQLQSTFAEVEIDSDRFTEEVDLNIEND